MNIRFLILATLAGACATSSIPSEGIDGGVDAPTFDAPTFDAPTFDAPSPLPDTGPRDAGPVRVDGGPLPFDGGPVIVDAGGPDIFVVPDSGVDAGPLCPAEGFYDLTPIPGNDRVCSVVGSGCRVSRTSPDALVVTCSGFDIPCSLGSECECEGAGFFVGTDITMSIDFPGQRASFRGAGNVCNFIIEMN